MSLTTAQLCMVIVAILLTGVSIVLTYMSRPEAAAGAYVAFLLAMLSGVTQIEATAAIFWGVATLIVLAIQYLLPGHVRSSRVGMPYFCTSALAGAFVGLILNSVAGVITATAAGVLLGAVAYSRLPGGNALEFPSRKFFNYLYAKGLPLVVIYSMLGILCLYFIIIGANI